jgi:hypothetical protein
MKEIAKIVIKHLNDWNFGTSNSNSNSGNTNSCKKNHNKNAMYKDLIGGLMMVNRSSFH